MPHRPDLSGLNDFAEYDGDDTPEPDVDWEAERAQFIQDTGMTPEQYLEQGGTAQDIELDDLDLAIAAALTTFGG